MIKEILAIGILLLAIPIGFLLNKLCWDELKAGRKWFKLIIAVGAAGVLALSIFGIQENLVAILTLVFLMIISWIGLGNKKFKR